MQNPIRPLGALLALALLPATLQAADPKPVAAEFPLGTCATCRLQAPAAAVWASASTDQDAVLARRFSSAGAALSTAFVVHQSDQASHRPTLPDVSHYGVGGAFVVVWQEGAGTAFGRRFTP
jgi:hypothetical protein